MWVTEGCFETEADELGSSSSEHLAKCSRCGYTWKFHTGYLS